MKVITLEEHFTTQKFQEAAGPESDMAQRMPQMLEKLLDLGPERVKAMDEAGIDVQILSFTGFGLYEMDFSLAADIAQDANAEITRAMTAFPERFGGFATLPMQDPEQAAQELDRCVRRLGFVGAMVDGMVDGVFLDDARFLPVFQMAASLDVPIYLHPAPPPAAVRNAYTDDLKPPFDFLLSTAAWGWHVETGLHALRLMISGLFDRLPHLKIILGHMGENLPYSIVRADTVLRGAGLKLDRSPVEVFQKNFWITSSGYFSIPPVLCARRVIGTERILLSVDYPFSELSRGPAMLEGLRSELTDDEIEGFASRNAANLLGL
jgi:predicted TIM-barrel fold metal-dependent hydrolase